MRMIETDDVKTLFARVLFAAYEFFRPNQKAVALCLLFAGVRDGISLNHNFASVFKSPQHQTAAFERIISLAVGAHLFQMWVCDRYHESQLPQKHGGIENRFRCRLPVSVSLWP